MPTIPQLREAIEDALATLDTIRVTQEAETVKASSNAVAAIVEKGTFTYDSMMGQQGEALNFTITLLAGRVSERAAKDRLDALCDPSYESTTSVRSALNGTLGGLAAWCTVTEDSEYREYPIGDGEAAPRYLGCQVTVQVGT